MQKQDYQVSIVTTHPAAKDGDALSTRECVYQLGRVKLVSPLNINSLELKITASKYTRTLKVILNKQKNRVSLGKG